MLTMPLLSFNTHSQPHPHPHPHEWKSFAPNPNCIQLNSICECIFQLYFLVVKFLVFFFFLLPANAHADDGAHVMGDDVLFWLQNQENSIEHREQNATKINTLIYI